MQNNNLFSHFQYGFIPKRSTTLQLLKVLDYWTKALDEGYTIDTVYMDFQKAFDKVPHKRLLYKIAKYGINHQILKWIESYLDNRTQYVTVKGNSSTLHKVTSGIPQGTVLGPLLFVIYINDLPNNILTNIYMFADDTKLFNVITSPLDKQTLQDDLYTIMSWSTKWLLPFNLDKCKYMHIANISSNESYNYYLETNDGTRVPLTPVTEENDLGICFDNTLEFDKHINSKINKANSISGLIRRTFQYLDKPTFLLLYKALVRSQLEYASSVWNPYLKKHIVALENVQRRATRLIPGMKHLEYPERLQTLQLPTLAYRRTRGDMIETYKILHNLYDHNCSNMLKLHSSFYVRETRGHKLKLYHEHSRLKKRKHSFPNRVVSLWNSLPEKVALAPTLNQFKNEYDSHFRNSPQLYNFDEPLQTRPT